MLQWPSLFHGNPVFGQDNTQAGMRAHGDRGHLGQRPNPENTEGVEDRLLLTGSRSPPPPLVCLPAYATDYHPACIPVHEDVLFPPPRSSATLRLCAEKAFHSAVLPPETAAAAPAAPF